MKNKIENIILHCSDSEFGSADIIRQWHKANGWRDIGYHFVITNGVLTSKAPYMEENDGLVQCGRSFDGDSFITDNEVGAHALGYNSKSVGICLIGKTRFTAAQFGAAFKLIGDMCRKYDLKSQAVLGHYETAQAGGKTCPNIDMGAFRTLLKKTI